MMKFYEKISLHHLVISGNSGYRINKKVPEKFIQEIFSENRRKFSKKIIQ